MKRIYKTGEMALLVMIGHCSIYSDTLLSISEKGLHPSDESYSLITLTTLCLMVLNTDEKCINIARLYHFGWSRWQQILCIMYKRASSMLLPFVNANWSGSSLFSTSVRTRSNTFLSRISITVDVNATGWLIFKACGFDVLRTGCISKDFQVLWEHNVFQVSSQLKSYLAVVCNQQKWWSTVIEDV